MAKKSEKKKHITRISAKSGANSQVEAPAEPANSATTEQSAQKSKEIRARSTQNPKEKTAKSAQKAQKTKNNHKSIKETKLFARPFVALGRYIRDSWLELRQVRWPDRKATWKMTLAVLIYCAIMMIFILLLDTLFTFLFNLAFK